MTHWISLKSKTYNGSDFEQTKYLTIDFLIVGKLWGIFCE